jgi:hypothetical protein
MPSENCGDAEVMLLIAKELARYYQGRTQSEDHGNRLHMEYHRVNPFVFYKLYTVLHIY